MSVLGVIIPPLWLWRALAVVLITIGTLFAARVSGSLVRRSIARSGIVPATSIFVNITRIFVVVLGVIFVLMALEIPVAPIVTALGVGGLAVALALQDTLSNLFAGLQIVASKQIHSGDYLLLDTGQEGTVVDVAWRTTTLRTQSDNLVLVPNAKLSQAIVTNYRLPYEHLSVAVDFVVGYEADLAEVEKIATDVAAGIQADQTAVADTPVVFRFKALADTHVMCTAVLRAATYADQFAVRSAFIKQLHARLVKAGVRFPYSLQPVQPGRK